jgi:DNA-binding NarL/FixJ family response regulator
MRVQHEEIIMLQATSKEPITVLILEDDAVTRHLLAAAIASEPTLKLAAALSSVQQALAWLKQSKVDLLLTDLGLPDGSGIDVIRACLKRCPECDVMVITMSSDEESVLACIEAGAAGYVLKDAGGVDIVRALLDLHAGGSPISPAIARKVLARVRLGRTPALSVSVPEASLLTRRETAILDLIARGDSYGDVARELSVSVGTVQTHVKNIYGKLAVHSRGEAVFEAHRRGLLQMHALKARA